jgi:hypothetical protein
MEYYIIEPEVAGGFGKNTLLDSKTHPPVVQKLHYELDGWLGDELLETFPCYIVTQQLRQKFENAGMTGTGYATVEVTPSEQFEEFYPGRLIPNFVWLQVNGSPGIDDFGISKDNRLVVSERVLKMAVLKHCDVTDFSEQ